MVTRYLLGGLVALAPLAALAGESGPDSALIDHFIRKFSAPLLQLEAAKARYPEEGDPPLVLLAFPLDVTGDGRPEWFLGTSEEKERSLQWQAYFSPESPGAAPQPLGGTIRLPADGFFIRREGTSTILSAYQRGTDATYQLHQYRFHDRGTLTPEIRTPEGREVLYLRRAKSPPGLDLGRHLRPATRVILLQDHLRQQPLQWRAYNFDAAPHVQFAHLPEEYPQATPLTMDTYEVRATGPAVSSYIEAAAPAYPESLLPPALESPRSYIRWINALGIVLGCLAAYLLYRSQKNSLTG